MTSSQAHLSPEKLDRFELHISEVMPALYSWAYLRVGPKLRTHLDPHDVVQEVATRAFRAYGYFDGGEVTFRAWTFRIAKNYLAETIRSAAVVRRADQSATDVVGISHLPMSATNISVRLERSDSLRALLDLVAGADAEERELFVRCALQGESCTKAARRMAISANAAQKRWMRFRERLRERPWVEELLSTIE